MKICIIGAFALALFLFLKPALADIERFSKSIWGELAWQRFGDNKNWTTAFQRNMQVRRHGVRYISFDVGTVPRIGDGQAGHPASPARARATPSTSSSVGAVRSNGYSTARMTLEKIGAKGLRLKTIDKDPKSGRLVVTSDIQLSR